MNKTFKHLSVYKLHSLHFHINLCYLAINILFTLSFGTISCYFAQQFKKFCILRVKKSLLNIDLVLGIQLQLDFNSFTSF